MQKKEKRTTKQGVKSKKKWLTLLNNKGEKGPENMGPTKLAQKGQKANKGKGKNLCHINK